uniref:Glucocorticoid-induced transcript 1 protein n=1 Tax=Homalodisca liturata TaxID=320908 RepID=A0A1B6HY80_9HEMI
MSGQSSQWVRKSSPSSKQGPMKATLPMSSLTRQNSNLIQSQNNSPTLSPTSSWKSRTSPDPSLSGLRSPGAVNYRGRCKRHGLEYLSTMRRTASLDAIYLMGQWPRDMYSGLLQVDKATQTDETMGDPRKAHRYTEPGANEDKLEKYIRHRLQRVGKESSSRERTAAFSLMMAPLSSTEHGSQTATPPPFSPVNLPGKHRTPMRSSIEGLNQEIERLVLKATSTLSTEREEEKMQMVHQATPEGHRAPLADLLRSTRSVNTQTPAFTSSSHSSGPPSRESGSPLVVGSLELNSRPSSELQGSGDSSPEQDSRPGTSPRINKFLAREPPDGCERVSLKFSEDASNRKPMLDLSLMEMCPIKPSAACQFKPSLGSAFMPLSRQAAASASASHEPPTQL